MRQDLLAKCVLAVVVTTAALAGCGGNGSGGGGGSGGGAAPPEEKPFMGTTVQSLLEYMNQLIARTDETSEPQPVDATPLPVDDTV
ncbi:hypothetical protein [Hydrogenophaga sp.]|uniref:hypothetical protein n=1 Tax=Hydrogenophaga sp. TaxID=1904254 RepID=UPI00272554AF|nr:hypothetical protein [Hydrogenophaga sp.]MDO9436936.1 hypothetical protein [Hydrogenophaga sp.]